MAEPVLPAAGPAVRPLAATTHFQLLGGSTVRKAIAFLGVIGVALLLSLRPAVAQTITSSLSGTVADASGAVVPGAQVVLTDEATGTTHTAIANGSGHFDFTAIFPGTYDLKVTATGFAPFEEKGIVLNQHESRTVSNIALKVGTTSQEVTVTAATEAVPIGTGASSTTLNNTMVSQIAIQGRDAAELIRLMPGMAINSGLNNTEWNSSVTQINTGPIGAFSSNGTQPNGSMQLIMNGSVITDAGNQGTQIANINQDMTQEVTIQDSAFDAEYAHGPVAFSAAGKRGTREFHGELYEYTRNGSLNANNSFFNAKGVAKPIDHYWYSGGNLGGPIYIPGTDFNKSHKRAFFFFGFEHLKQEPAGALHQYFVPTQAMMQGDFTQSSLAPYAKFTGGSGNVPCADVSGFWNYNTFCQNAVDTGKITLFAPGGAPISPAQYDASITAGSPLAVAGSRISPSLIDPNGQTLMKLLANAPGLKPINPMAIGSDGLPTGFNAQFLDNPPVNSNEMNLRGDFSITDKMKAFASFTRQTEGDINSIGLWWWAPNAVPYPSQTPANQVSKEYSFGVTNTISPTIINEANFGYAYFINPVTLTNASAANPATYSYNVTTPYAQPVPQIPDIVSWCCSPGSGGGINSATPSAGFNASSFGTSPSWYGKAAGKDSYTPDFSDNFTWVKGTHTMKFGFFWARYANVQTEGACCGGGTVGQWDFDPWAYESTNNIYADMLIGHPASFSMASTNFVDNVRYNEYDFFAQDAWQVRPGFTLSFGVRFDREGQWYPANENKGIMVWDPTNSIQPYSPTSTAPLAGFAWHGIDNNVPISGWATRRFYPDPRVGVSWDIFGNGRTVLRGGFGVYRFNVAYNDVTENGMLDAPLGLKSFSSNCTFTSLSGLGTCGAATAAARNSQSYGGMLRGDNSNPYTQTWDVIVDQHIPLKSMLELKYVGNRSRNLLLSSNGGGGIAINNINYIPIGGLFKPDPVTGITYYCQGPQTATCVSSAPPPDAVPDYRPYDYSSLYLFRHGSYSNYNGLVVEWIKQSGPAVFNLNYTYSHALGIRDGNNDNGQGGGAALDAFNIANNYGTLAYNRTHIFNASYVISLPSPIHQNAFLEQAINGWQLSGVTQYQTGPPIQPLSGTGLNPTFPGGMTNQSMLGTDGIELEPYQVCNPAANLGPGQYFNPNCFMAPNVRGVNGPLVWPNITGPAFFDTDLGIYKTFNFTERQHLQFRITAFNFLNHPVPQFGLGNDINLAFTSPGGFNTNQQTTGRPAFKVGNRTVELALKYTF